MQSLYLGSVSLFYAKDRYNNPRLIEEVDDGNKDEEYVCYVCGSKVRPRALDSECVARHFYHVTGSDCSTESVMHYWYKNIYLQAGDKFKLLIDGKYIEYTCKEVLVEQTYTTITGDYRPDATVVTECGKKIFIEYDYTNKKKASEYIDRWTELDCTVVELNISKLKDWKEKVFKPVFHNGESLIDNSVECHSLIKKCLTEIEKRDRQRVKYLNWLLRDLQRYNTGEITIDELVVVIDGLTDIDIQCLIGMVKGLKCQNILNDYAEYKRKIIKSILNEELINNGIKSTSLYDWIFKISYGRLGKFNAARFNNTIKIYRRKNRWYNDTDIELTYSRDVIKCDMCEIRKLIIEVVDVEAMRYNRNLRKILQSNMTNQKTYMYTQFANYMNSKYEPDGFVFRGSSSGVSFSYDGSWNGRAYDFLSRTFYKKHKGSKRINLVENYFKEKMHFEKEVWKTRQLIINNKNNILESINSFINLELSRLSIVCDRQKISLQYKYKDLFEIEYDKIIQENLTDEDINNHIITEFVNGVNNNSSLFLQTGLTIIRKTYDNGYNNGDIRTFVKMSSDEIYAMQISRKRYYSYERYIIAEVEIDKNNKIINLTKSGHTCMLKFVNCTQMKDIINYICEVASMNY